MTPRDVLWEEEFAILVGSEGAYRAADVWRMTPEKRVWVLRRIRRMQERMRRTSSGVAGGEPKIPRRR